MENDLSHLMENELFRLKVLETNSAFDVKNLNHAEYATLRDLAAKYLTYQTLFQCLQPKLPYKPGVKEAWEKLADCILCSDEEADKRRKLEYETESRMMNAKIKHDREKRHQYEQRKKAIATALGQQYKLQKVVDELQQSMSELRDQLHSLQ
tara:strand:+ start:450 stop:905 length:456 start_codon:yes stop_codon:yes gene_type:complete